MNFTPLDQLHNRASQQFSWAVAAFFICIFSVFIFSAISTEVTSTLLLFLFVSILVCGWAYLRKRSEAKRNVQVLVQFAAANGMQTFLGDDFIAGPGTLFTHGHAPKTKTVINGTVANLPFSLFDYKYVTGSGKTRREHNATVMRLTLPRVLPHMVIDSKLEGGSSNTSVLPIEFDDSQRIELEGDFNMYFSCYAPDQYGVSLLSIIGPDAMWSLLEHAAMCDIEIIDNAIYFYWPFITNRREQYEHMFATVDGVMKAIGQKLTQSDIYATQTQASLHSSEQTQGVHLQKLRITWVDVALFLGLTLVLSAIFMLQTPPAGGTVRDAGFTSSMFIIGFITIFTITLSVSRARRQAYLRKQLDKRFSKK